ncbi:hypothetical protein J7S33_31860, partial [Saccharothrix algeriensis]
MQKADPLSALSDRYQRAALGYVELRWPVLPGGVLHEGRLVDPVTEDPVANVNLHPTNEATTDVDLVRRW